MRPRRPTRPPGVRRITTWSRAAGMRHMTCGRRRKAVKEGTMPWGMHTKDTPGKGRILIVDDEESIRKALRLTLSKAGYDVVEADDGAEGIEAIGTDDNPLMVDVIICDIRMPKINGLEAIAFSASSTRRCRCSFSPGIRTYSSRQTCSSRASWTTW